jgi:23S rRNA (cytosine1962-C5)-methyltransferase
MARDVPVVHLRPGHVQPIWAGHPWVYAQAIARVEGEKPEPGDVVRVVDPQGHALGRGFWSQRRAIPVRIVSRDDAESLDDEAWLVDRMTKAIARRATLGLPADGTDGYRVVHAEGDGVPGLVVDRFGDVAVAQVGTAGLRRRAAQIVAAIERTLAPKAIRDRTSPSVAQQEGFTLPQEGASSNESTIARGGPIDALRFTERGLSFEIPTELGQKTGYYFDQRGLRARVEALSKGRRVLDAFCYVGPIAMAAARGGAASVRAIDDSMRALEVGAACAKKNGLSIAFERGDVRRELPKIAAEGARFDLVVLDPPKLAPTRGDRDAALQYQTRLVQEASALVDPNGLLVVCSCSTALGSNDLARALAIGARRAGRSATVLERLGQGGDHPVPAAFPEGIYLSTLIAEMGIAELGVA